MTVYWLKAIRCMAKLEGGASAEIGGRTCTFSRQ